MHPHDPAKAVEKSNHDAEMRDYAMRLWNGSEPAAGTIAETYLRHRGLLDLAHSPALRFRTDCWHKEQRRSLPAMIAEVLDANGRFAGIHRTYLTTNGSSKAVVDPPRKTLGPIWGGAIRLDHVASEIIIGEGIETAASAGRLLGLPAWAALSGGNLGRGVVLPREVRRVVIAADPDAAGRDAARNAWLRWRAERRDVRIATLVHDGSDFNDLLRARLVGEVR
jgi:hypothetical protein